MKIFYLGNTFKYETEAVLKLFFPLERFEFAFDEAPLYDTDCAVIALGDELSVEVCLNGTRVKKASPLKGGDNELELCRMLFSALSGITGIVPDWGCLTGIRPVKKINALLAKGLSYEEIAGHLGEKYFLRENKALLSYRTALTQKNALDTLSPKSYSLYVGIPFCTTRCSYCSFVSHTISSKGARELIPRYVEMLCREIADTGSIMRNSGRVLDTVYIGGGTPTAISAPQLDAVMSAIEKHFDLSSMREYSVEAGRADTIDRDKLSVIKSHGATRISINPQSLNDEVLKNIGRAHTAGEFMEAFALARSMGFDNINTDTIAGLPGDDYDSFCATIEGLIALSPENITVHTLTVKRSASLFAGASREDFARDGDVSRMVDGAGSRLLKAGYSPYYLYRQKNTIGNLENTGFCKPGRESLYNIYIMEECQDIIACGAGGSTKLTDPETGKITRYFNYKYPYEYISRYDKMVEYKKLLADSE